MPTWAPNVNYPVSADPWSATPTKVAHPGAASVGITPKSGVAGQVFNKVIHEAYAADTSAKDRLNELVNFTGQQAALNFRPASTCTGDLAKYRAGTWYFSSKGTADLFFRSNDLLSINSVTELPAPAKTTFVQADFDVDPSGNIVIVDESQDQMKHYTAGTTTWAKFTVAGNTLVKPSLVYAVTAGLWCVAGPLTTGGGPINVRTSANRTTWTSRTPPTGFSGVLANAGVSLGHDGAGVIVMQLVKGTDVTFSRSTDGGITWGAPQTLALGFTGANPGYWPRPIWNGSYWLAHVTDGVNATKIYKSTDGAAWSQVASFTATRFRSIAAMGELWLALTGATSGIHVSTDGGATWRKFDLAIPGDTVASNAIRFLVLHNAGGNAYPSHAMGLGLELAT